MVDGYGKDQVETGHADGYETWIKGLRWLQEGPWWLTLGDINKQEEIQRSRSC
jgi:hypothetical protein